MTLMPTPMINWSRIDTVFLDMDGTLLDLHFDNHFWREHVPMRYAEKLSLDIAEAKAELYERFRRAEGTLDWYCIDYWSNELGLDIAILKEEVDHLIAIHPHVIDFLDAVRTLGRRITLVTNAHGRVLDLKMDRTKLGGHFDRLISAHDLGLPKEHAHFWGKLSHIEAFDANRTLLVDDSLPVLRSAQDYGIAHLLAVRKPDSKQDIKDAAEFNAIDSFRDILPR